MGDAYTPGLTVCARTRVRKTRRLPLQGTVLAAVGDRVGAEDVVARTELPGKVTLLNFANLLGVLADEIEPALRVRPGEAIRRGQLLAEHRAFFGLSRARVESPLDGTFESVSAVTGQAVLRDPPRAVELRAYIDGTVVEIVAGEGVVIEAEAALVQGIFGLAGEANAPLVQVGKSRDAVLEAGDLSAEHAGKIVVGGGRAALGAMRAAFELGVAGVVVGGFAYQDVRELLGYDVGVAVTGGEPIPTTLVLTEGFGSIAMAATTYELLARHDGRRASISGATQIRAGVIRPEVIITDPIDAPSRAADTSVPAGLDVGAPVRCIRAPHFGKIGVVVALPVELVKMPSETMVRVVEVDLGEPGRVVVPRANVEVIERS
ncbi:MAG TPA: hypothetical protein VNO33_01535 [Kofleriaceae bacterium]|nr:hypothetical protein [Kofleriaceae bacterium]